MPKPAELISVDLAERGRRLGGQATAPSAARSVAGVHRRAANEPVGEGQLVDARLTASSACPRPCSCRLYLGRCRCRR
jgi:hypothetical protein